MKRKKIASFLVLASLGGGKGYFLFAEEDKEATATQESKQEYWGSYSPYSNQKIIADEVTSEVNVQDILESPQDYSYASFGKANPFIPPLVSDHLAKLEIPIVSILQKYQLDQLIIGGIWLLENGERKALVMTPQNEGVIARVGDPIGNRGGKVISIAEKILKVREFTLAPDGTRLFEDFDLWLGNELPSEEEKIIISSKLSNPLGKESDPSKDALETNEAEEKRAERFYGHAVDGPAMPQPLKQGGLTRQGLPPQQLIPAGEEAKQTNNEKTTEDDARIGEGDGNSPAEPSDQGP